MPRANYDYYSIKTDPFTLGINSSLHLRFTDLDQVEDEDETQKRFRERRFPPVEKHEDGNIIQKC